MTILHLPVAYLPWTTGGREVYCHSLARALGELGIRSVVAIHQDPSGREPLGWHEHDGVKVAVLPPLRDLGSRKTWSTREFSEVPGFDGLLSEVRPDAVHFHDQGGGASLSHLRLAKQRHLPTVLTYHSPGQTCPQTELLRCGRTPCDGELIVNRCTSCRLQSAGVPRWMSRVLGTADFPGVDPWSQSRVSRVLSTRSVIRLFRESLDEFTDLADIVVVLADWARDVWLKNGCPNRKLRLVRSGGSTERALDRGPRFPNRKVLRIGCLGRCDRSKGFHVLIDAVKTLDRLPLEVHFLGPYWESPYGLALKGRIASDRRFLEPRLVPHSQLLGQLAELDLVVIPSVWLETGPLTLFDAWSAGVPVVGSRLGGLAETIREGVNGVLFTPGDPTELGKIISRFVDEPESLEALRQGVLSQRAGPPRTFREVAAEMAPIYRSLSHRYAEVLG
jgi:glycosyltransferase involved in cell wall biosynthesis